MLKIKNLNFPKKDVFIGALVLVVLVVAFVIFNSLSIPVARSWDIKFGYYAILSTFIILVAGLVVNAKDIIQTIQTHRPSSKSLLILSAVLAFFLLFILANIENSHRVLSDETSWESMGLQMFFQHSGGVCNEGIWSNGALQCYTEVNNFKGKALAFVYSIVFLFAEPGRDTALLVNLPLYLLSLIFFFFSLSIWFKSEKLALAATAFLGGMPIYLLQSRSASTEVLYIFLLTALMSWYASISPKQVTWKHFLLTVPLLGFFAQTRQETVFAFIPFALYYVSYFREKVYRLPLFVVSVIAVSWPSINTMAAYRGYDFQGGEHAAHSLSNFWFNIQSNIEIMLNLKKDSSFGGIMQNPFYTSFTIILLLATVWLLGRLIISKKYKRGALLAILFSIQIFVILLNVSGTFQIDINQRYVLVALPLFALIMALGLKDFLSTVLKIKSDKSSTLVLILSIVLSVGLAFFHVFSYRMNMLYYKNKLLVEEHYLNTHLKTYPKESVFIYSRPWQMLASGHSSFSERTFMNWSTEEFLSWMKKTNNNIYIVRGQDGYGEVNRKSRVVGFKTTNQIEIILKDYKTKRLLIESRPFGYPLTIHQLISKKGFSHYTQNMTFSEWNGQFILMKKKFEDSIRYDVMVNDSLNEGKVLSENVDTLWLDSNQVQNGLNRALLLMYMPDGDTFKVYKDFFKPSPNAVLLSEMPFASSEQSWGQLRLNQTVEGRPFSLDGESFRYGLGVHAKSKNTFDLNGSFSTFEAMAGLDDESACGDGASFVVLADGRELFRSLKMYSRDKQKVSLPMQGVRRLELVVEEGDNIDCDHAVWANAWLRRVE